LWMCFRAQTRSCAASVSCCCVHDAASSAIYTLSLHDALPICSCPRGAPGDHCRPDRRRCRARPRGDDAQWGAPGHQGAPLGVIRSEEHTSELQSRENLVCRLLLEKKKKYEIQMCPELLSLHYS